MRAGLSRKIIGNVVPFCNWNICLAVANIVAQ